VLFMSGACRQILAAAAKIVNMPQMRAIHSCHLKTAASPACCSCLEPASRSMQQGRASGEAHHSATRCCHGWPQPQRAQRAVHVRSLQADSGGVISPGDAKSGTVPYAAIAEQKPQRAQRADHVWRLRAYTCKRGKASDKGHNSTTRGRHRWPQPQRAHCAVHVWHWQAEGHDAFSPEMPSSRGHHTLPF
jgi:hypothetical protein